MNVTSWWPEYKESTHWRYIELKESFHGLVRNGNINTRCQFWNDDKNDTDAIIEELIQFAKDHMLKSYEYLKSINTTDVNKD